jgi:hypothetical protein
MTGQADTKKQINANYIVWLMLFVVLACGYFPLWAIFSNIASAQEDNSPEIPDYLLSSLGVSPWVGLIIVPAILVGLLVLAFRHKLGADGKDNSDEFWSILLTAFGFVFTAYSVMFTLFSQISSYIPTPGGGLAMALLLYGCPPVVIFLLMGLRLALLPKQRKIRGWYGIGLLLTFVLPVIILYLGLI